MTTAHRATWKAARGGLEEESSLRLNVPSAAISSKDAPTERVLKERDVALQLSRGQLRARMDDLPVIQQALPENFERPSKRLRGHSRFAPSEISLHDKNAVTATQLLPSENAELNESTNAVVGNDTGEPEASSKDHDDSEYDGGSGLLEGLRAGDEVSESADESDSDDEEDEAELLAEVERIRKERELERAKRQANEQERLQKEEEERIINDNPLLANMSSALRDELSDTASLATGSVAFSVRRRWDDDVVFRNQARQEQPRSARFINDTVHNDFHKRFMKKYMR